MKQVTMVEDDETIAEEENKIINEEYKTWKKNAPFLYDVCITHALLWPSLTCQWFPDRETPSNKPYTVHRLLLGTHTSGQAQDLLQIATVQIPKRDGSADRLDRSTYDDEHGELGGHTLPSGQPRVQVIQRINHPNEVNRARYMPQNPDLIATQSVGGDVLVWDRTKHSSEPERGGAIRPDIRLVGQTKEGFGLAWNPNKRGHVLACSEDMTICHWDVNSYSKANNTIDPLAVYRGHTSVVGAVDWHSKMENVFASVGDDKTLRIWDTRSETKASTSQVEAHDKDILSVAFSPAVDSMILTGSGDCTAALWDIRNLSKRMHSFEMHSQEVLHVAWSPHNAPIFASAGADRRINIWDIRKIGDEQSPDDAEDGPPELLFMHGGHTSRPADFSWAPHEQDQWHIASVSEDNIVMAWQPSMHIWAAEDVKIDEKELEGDAMEGVEASGSGSAAAAKAPTGNGTVAEVGAAPGSAGEKGIEGS